MFQATRFALVGIIVCLSCAAAQGAQIAFDSAGDSAYNNGWIQGSNGGYGWGGGWNFDALPSAPPIIGDSTTNGSGDQEGDGDINSPRAVGGRAWGMPLGRAMRAFNSPLTLGQTFLIDFDDYGGFSPNFNSAVYLLGSGGAEVIGIKADVVSQYLIETNTGTINTGVPETDQGIHIVFTELAAGVQVSITPYLTGATTTTLIAPYTGQLTGMEFDSTGPGFGLGFIPYINNMAITPEPSGLGLVALALPGLAARRRRR